MAAHDLAQAATQEAGVEAARKADAGRNVVERARELELLEKPEPLLREREDRLAVHLASNRSGSQPLAFSDRLLDALGQLREDRPGEGGGQGKIDPESLVDAHDELRDQQRMPAKLEEIVSRPDFVTPEEVHPDSR